MTTPMKFLKLVAAILLVVFDVFTAGIDATPSWQGDAQTLLTQTLRGIGDIASARASMSVDDPIDWEYPSFSRQSGLTNVYDSGAVTISGDVFNAEIQYITLLCICDDADCSVQVAADLSGVVQVDRGDFVGYSPLFLLDENGSKIPCLSVFEKDRQELDFQGCDLVNSSQSAAIFYVENCDGNDLTKFGVLEGDSLIARPYSNYELLPDDISDSFDPTQTIEEVFGNISVQETLLQLRTDVTILGFEVPITFEEDIGPLLSQAGGALALGFIDSIASTFLPTTFNATFPASQASVADVYRVLLAFSILRLFRLVAPWEEIARSTVAGDSVYGDLVATQPDLIPLPEILSGITLLLLVAAGFGYAATTNHVLSLAVAGAFLVLATECSSYVIRLVGSIKLEQWGATMLLVDTSASSRNYALPLGGGLDGSALAVTVAYVKLSNASNPYLWLQYVGAGLAFIAFFLGVFKGRRANQEALAGAVSNRQVADAEVVELLQDAGRAEINGCENNAGDDTDDRTDTDDRMDGGTSDETEHRNEVAEIEFQVFHRRSS
jgi:hypothetical protein